MSEWKARSIFEPLERRLLLSVSLSGADISAILAQAAANSIQQQAIVICDRQGYILAIYAQPPSAGDAGMAPGSNPAPLIAADYSIEQAAARARTAAAFSSSQNAFTTRTARFIIQDHFPQPIMNTPGGPLYGVEFSSLPGTDVLPAGLASGINGDPGGVPLYIDGQCVGAIGVAGDGLDVAPRGDLLPAAGSIAANADPGGTFYNGAEEGDFDEAVALAGAQGYMAPAAIQANQIFVGGLRLPFVAEGPSTSSNPLNLLGLRDNPAIPGPARAMQTFGPLTPATPEIVFPPDVIAGQSGSLDNPNPEAAGFGIIAGDATSVPLADQLTAGDVRQILTQGVAEAQLLRAAIREPIGVDAKVFVSVVDADGDILGVFSMSDTTLFSYDVSIQKARTAAYFSDNADAFGTRAVGFVAQRFFPPGIDSAATGPLFQLQNALSVPANLGPMLGAGKNPLPNGINIFPGGVPLYKNGVLVGGVGVSGDGVDQDDIIAFSAATGFEPDNAIRSDSLSQAARVAFLETKVNALPGLGFTFPIISNGQTIIDIIDQRLGGGLQGVRLPFVKFPRNPDLGSVVPPVDPQVVVFAPASQSASAGGSGPIFSAVSFTTADAMSGDRGGRKSMGVLGISGADSLLGLLMEGDSNSTDLLASAKPQSGKVAADMATTRPARAAVVTATESPEGAVVASSAVAVSPRISPSVETPVLAGAGAPRSFLSSLFVLAGAAIAGALWRRKSRPRPSRIE